jgi:hypothetical protein
MKPPQGDAKNVASRFKMIEEKADRPKLLV